MSAIIVDTSSWITYFAGRGNEFIESALAESQVFLPPLVAAELLSGKMTANQRTVLESLLADLAPCNVELPHWFAVGRLRRDLLSRGISVSTPDAHIAQCALDLDADLITEDSIFGRIARHYPLRLREQKR